MHSSTSNSNARIPSKPLLRSWGVGLVIAALCVGGWETFWRFQGYRPSLQDNAELWSLIRAQASDSGQDSVVFIGSSRVQGGLRPDAYAAVMGQPEPLQLAIGGCKPTPVLADLASDESFNGTVICGVMPAMLFARNPGGEMVYDFVEYYHRESVSPSARVERVLRGWVQDAFCFRIPELAPGRARQALKERKWSKQNYRLLQPDRCRNYDMSLLLNVEARIEDVQGYLRSRRPLDEEGVIELVKELNAYAQEIQVRGGRVVFLRMPSSGAVWALEEELFPRAHYWDVLASGTDALAIHFADYAELAKYTCPEGSHLAYQDAAPFTRDFAQVLKREFAHRNKHKKEGGKPNE